MAAHAVSLLGNTVAGMVGNLIMAALALVILPVYAREVFDSPHLLGFMIAAYGVGGLIGTALFGAHHRIYASTNRRMYS